MMLDDTQLDAQRREADFKAFVNDTKDMTEKADDNLSVVSEIAEADEVKIKNPHAISEVRKAQGDAFIALVQSGVSAKQAATSLGTSLREIKRDPEVQRKIESLINTYTLSAAERRALVRARANKMVLDDTVEDRDALTAMRLISDDPEVGLTKQNINTAVQMNFDAKTVQVLQTTDNLQIPGIDEEK